MIGRALLLVALLAPHLFAQAGASASFLAENAAYVNLECAKIAPAFGADQKQGAYASILKSLRIETKGAAKRAVATFNRMELKTPSIPANADDVGALIEAGFVYSAFDLSSAKAGADPKYRSSVFHQNVARYTASAFAPFDHGEGADDRFSARLNSVSSELAKAPKILGDRWKSRDIRLFVLSSFYLDPAGLRYSAARICKAGLTDNILPKYAAYAIKTTESEFSR